tara:strand:- start:3877 stop:4158 length:282 start_codon:yes stop_codon:yes gene_type:complete
MPKINLIGASNLYTNSTANFGSMAGLAPTTNVRPYILKLSGYKYAKVLNDPNNYSKGCGYFKDSNQGLRCLKALNLDKNVSFYYRAGVRSALG